MVGRLSARSLRAGDGADDRASLLARAGRLRPVPLQGASGAVGKRDHHSPGGVLRALRWRWGRVDRRLWSASLLQLPVSVRHRRGALVRLSLDIYGEEQLERELLRFSAYA